MSLPLFCVAYNYICTYMYYVQPNGLCNMALIMTFIKDNQLRNFLHFIIKTNIICLLLIDQLTPTIAEIIWVKNVGAIVVCGFFMKWFLKNILKIWEKSWEPIKPISTQIGLDWLCYLAGNFQRAPTIFLKLSGYL